MTVDADEVLQLLGRRPRILALGEPTHGEDVLLEARNELFRDLVEQHGYRTITIESDCLKGRLVDDYVTGGTGDLDEVMAQGFSHGFGASAANRDLVAWMRTLNAGRPVPQRVRFAGFDGPLEISGADSPRQSLTALHGFLAARLDADLLPGTAAALDDLLGADERWPDPAVMYDPAKSVGRTPPADRLRSLTADLAALLDEQAPQLITAGREDWEQAQLYARTAAGLLRYHYWMADPSPQRIARLLGVRASMMAANLLALAGRGPVLAYAHNGHLQRDESSMQMGGHQHWWSAGAIVAAQLGGQYAHLVMALGTIRHHGVDVPPADTLEGLLYAQPQERCLVDPAVLADRKPAARVSPWFGYAALDPAHLGGIDGVVFVKDCPAQTVR